MARILVVDDEQGIRLTLQDFLAREGYEVTTAADGRTALQLIVAESFEVVLLDLNLGDIDGIEVLAGIRQQSPDTVTIMLTAYATLETALEALRQGAHDYLLKPSPTTELRASIRQGLLKRQQALRQRSLLRQLGQYFADNLEDFRAVLDEPVPLPSPSDLLVGEPIPELDKEKHLLQKQELMVDFSRHVITLEGHLLALTLTEFNLLAYLIREAPRVVSPQELIREIQGYEGERWEIGDIIRTHIYHIRQKIKKATGRTQVIRTVRGVGYTVNLI